MPPFCQSFFEVKRSYNDSECILIAKTEEENAVGHVGGAGGVGAFLAATKAIRASKAMYFIVFLFNCAPLVGLEKSFVPQFVSPVRGVHFARSSILMSASRLFVLFCLVSTISASYDLCPWVNNTNSTIEGEFICIDCALGGCPTWSQSYLFCEAPVVPTCGPAGPDSAWFCCRTDEGCLDLTSTWSTPVCGYPQPYSPGGGFAVWYWYVIGASLFAILLASLLSYYFIRRRRTYLVIS